MVVRKEWGVYLFICSCNNYLQVRVDDIHGAVTTHQADPKGYCVVGVTSLLYCGWTLLSW